LKDVQDVIRMLYFERGASMPETNAVRGMLVMLGQDRHPRYPGDATMIEFLTEEIPREIPYERVHARRASSAETSTPPYRRAVEVLKRYDLWGKVPQPVRTHLERADPRYDLVTPGELEGKPRYFIRVIGPEYMLEGARRRAEELGVHAHVLIKSLNDIEAQPVGEMMACIALSLDTYSMPFEPPCAILFGGETTVAVGEATGRGGRNQELALSAAPRIAGSKSIVVASVDSDGTDGPTDAAGGIVDGYTVERAREAGINVIGELKNHNSHEVLAKLGDAIYTGARSTNVRGLGVVYVGRSSR
jgi:glycerate 2-kinase